MNARIASPASLESSAVIAAQAPRPACEAGPAATTSSCGSLDPRFGHHFGDLRVLQSIQRKPAVSSPGDALELEADEVADQVMRKAAISTINGAPAEIQRKCSVCEKAAQSVEGRVEEEELMDQEQAVVQLKADFSATPAPARGTSPTVAGRLDRSQSGGEALAGGVRHAMEAAFGRDFSRVRVHRDGESASLSHQLSAFAFTRGSHIYFGSGKYDPEGSSGKRLLAHELTHVVQQGHAGFSSAVGEAPQVSSQRDATPEIQRVASVKTATPQGVNNLADATMAGGDVGVTSPTFNGVVFGPLAEPTIAVNPVASGGFDATVTTVAANVASVDERILSAGPWTRVMPKADVGARIPALAQCTGAGNTTFQAQGDPTDVAMAAANRRHENHHAADRLVAFVGTVVPWDVRLTVAQGMRTPFHGATEAAAKTALFAAMGGTATEVMTACLAAGAAARDAFHATAAGGNVSGPTSSAANATCSTSSAKFLNPS
ncbi:MAG TPA: DUF4157 domain-containing protein [Steroidobacteraceae bacterium]|jgi:hypothetical protein|nr:DUF4157 domain-containing protein [Steroidobacteraceae bacterium]